MKNESSNIDLEGLYCKNRPKINGLVANDPVEFVHRFSLPEDKEVAGFIASQFAYGRIGQFKRFLEVLFQSMGTSPYRFISKGDLSSLKGLYYRFQGPDDIIELFKVLRRLIEQNGSIGNLFRSFYHGDTRQTIWKIRQELFKGKGGLTFFFPEPSKANPLKRWNLFLRWMVRKDEVDAGLWDFIDKNALIIPLDTHIFSIARCQGWTSRNSPSYSSALEITDALRRFSPSDPLRYDFMLCHIVGIGASCKGKRSIACADRCIIY